jgi:hypothetical protein
LLHDEKHTFNKNIKIVRYQLRADLFVHLIFFFVCLFIFCSDFFGDDDPLDVFEALLGVLAGLELLALHDKDLLRLL